MSFTITVRDTSPSGKVTGELTFEVLVEQMTVRDLIRQRIHQEVQLYNLSTPGYFKGLVQPKVAPNVLPREKILWRRRIDWEAQAELALRAFEENAFVILVGDRQVETLDEPIEIDVDTEITFIKLMPLIGG
jgi:hypothetical protein